MSPAAASQPARKPGPAFLFDLDGTLVDSVYQHVLAWREALESANIELSVWRIHRRIGMSGGLFVNALARETGQTFSPEQAARLGRLHAEAYARLVPQVRPLPGARELLTFLTRAGVPWTIATSGRLESAQPVLDKLALPPGVPIVTRDQVPYAKPDPICSWPPLPGWAWTLKTRWWWATACGTCWRRAAPARSA